ncbi:hypothetical protein LTS12_016907 [Elasticomyces elasticus]|nr:hypothetical protein LTS12_016907 [Elasticomyces elasticus]
MAQLKAGTPSETWYDRRIHPRAKLVLSTTQSGEAPIELSKELELGRPPQSVPHTKSLSPGGHLLRKRLSEKDQSPVAILKEQIDKSIRLCLEEYYTRLSRHPRIGRRKLIRSDAIGSLTLQWLWQEGSRWATTVQQDMLLFNRLVHFLVAEECEHYVLGWIRSDLPQDARTLFTEESQNRWRGALLRALVLAHLMLDETATADPAIKVLNRVAQEVLALRTANRKAGKERDQEFAATSLWPAKVILAKSLYSGRFWNTDSHLYTQFIGFMVVEKKKKDTKFKVAKLHLHHPKTPNPGPMWSLLHGGLQGPAQQRMLEQSIDSGTAARVNLLITLDDLERVLRSQDRSLDADWAKATHARLLAESDVMSQKLYNFHFKSSEGYAKRTKGKRSSATDVRPSDRSLVRTYKV